MRIAIRVSLLCGLALLSAATADARERKVQVPQVRSGAARGPSIPHYNMRSFSGGMSGGNIRAYGEIMQERMIIQQQQYMIQQQRYMMQQMQKKNQANSKGKTNTPGSLNLKDPNAQPVYHHKTYNHGPVDPNFKPSPDTAR